MRETRHERYTRIATLPKDMADSCVVSFSIKRFLDTICNNLRTVFGDRADWRANIKSYCNRQEYLSKHKAVSSLDDFDEINKEIIQSWIEEEETFSETATKILDLFTVICGDDYYKRVEACLDASRLLGITAHSTESIYQHLVNLDGLTEEDKNNLLDKIKDNYPGFETIVKVAVRQLINGRLVTFPVIETVMTQQKRRYFYRGENAYYGSSKPGAYRRTESDLPEYMVQRINDLRREEGCLLFDNFISVLAWPDSTVNHIALAQHYGLKTQMIDITSDTMTALFFACCTYDDGKWRPLCNKDFAEIDSRPNVVKHGGDSRYGILFRCEEEIEEAKWLDDNGIFEKIMPIGYQPFMRCSSQHGYGLLTCNPEYDLYKDKRFEKYKIRLTEDLCNWVFEQTHEGKDVFPNHDVPNIEACFERINKTTSFSRKTFEQFLIENKVPKEQWERVEAEMNYYGYTLSDEQVQFISENEINHINETYPPRGALELTGNNPIADSMIIVMDPNSEKYRRDRALDDEKYKFMIVPRIVPGEVET